MNICLIIQARMGSTRLPQKILKKIENKCILQHVIDRCSKSKYINKIIVATTNNPIDDPVEHHCKNKDIYYYRGDENNVLKRFYNTALRYKPDIIVRVTSDCPLIDINILDNMLAYFINKNLEFLHPEYSNTSECGSSGGFPDGTNPQIFTFDLLEKTYKSTTDKFDCEHVCPYMIKHYSTFEYKIPNIEKYKNIDFSNLHLSIDTQTDYVFVSKIFKKLYKNSPHFTIYDVLDIINLKVV